MTGGQIQGATTGEGANDRGANDRTPDILYEKKFTKLSAREMPGEEEGNGGEDRRFTMKSKHKTQQLDLTTAEVIVSCLWSRLSNEGANVTCKTFKT